MHGEDFLFHFYHLESSFDILYVWCWVLLEQTMALVVNGERDYPAQAERLASLFQSHKVVRNTLPKNHCVFLCSHHLMIMEVVILMLVVLDAQLHIPVLCTSSSFIWDVSCIGHIQRSWACLLHGSTSEIQQSSVEIRCSCDKICIIYVKLSSRVMCCTCPLTFHVNVKVVSNIHSMCLRKVCFLLEDEE